MAKFDVVKAIFNQADANRDGTIDRNEFRSWVGAGSASGGFNSSTYESSTGGADASYGLAYSGNAGLAGQSAGSGYEASYSSQSGVESGGGSLAGGGLDSSYAAGASSEFVQTGGATLEASSEQQLTQITSSSGLFNDPNPQVIRRPATGGVLTYQQKVLVRFLQPPPIPPPGPLIIKEIRPPQPPPPPPLVVRQRAPPLPQPPPLILRERPPVPPESVASQTVIRRLEALPIPPRSVIIERLPPLPPKPRDIIIERWIPYGAQAKRRTIVQRAAAATEYQKPRNIIITYEPVQVRIVRQFQRLGVAPENPQAYVSRYGASLLDAATLLQQARAAGVVEDISPPANTAVSAQFSASASGTDAGYNYSSLSSNQQLSSTGEATGLAGGTQGLEITTGGDAAGGSYSSQSYSSSSTYGTEGASAGGTGANAAGAAFAAADTNQDGSLDQTEFRQYLQGGL